MLKKIVQITSFLLLLFTAGMYIVINHSVVETNHRCTMRSGEPATVFVKLQEYRRWVGIWSESEGRLWIEEDGGVLHYFSQLEIGAALIFIRRSESEPSRSGKWSKVSNRLSVELAGRQFAGTCETVRSLMYE